MVYYYKMNWKYIREVVIIHLIQHFEANFLWKVGFKILNSGLILKTFTHVFQKAFEKSYSILTYMLYPEMIKIIWRCFLFVCLIIYVPVNNFSVMSGLFFLDWTSTNYAADQVSRSQIQHTDFAGGETRASNPLIPSRTFNQLSHCAPLDVGFKNL